MDSKCKKFKLFIMEHFKDIWSRENIIMMPCISITQHQNLATHGQSEANNRHIISS